MKKQWCIGGITIAVFLIVLGGGHVLAQRSTEESDYQEVLNKSSVSTVNSSENEMRTEVDSARQELEQIIASYEKISSDFMIHCEVEDDMICKVDISLKCKDHLSGEDELAIKEQLAEFMCIPTNDISITSVLLSEN